MKAFLAGVKRWYLRRFRGIVEPPAHAKGQGTTWQQHYASGPDIRGYICKCGFEIQFTPDTYVIMSQEHIEGCEGVFDSTTHAVAKASSRILDLVPCNCPVTEARYVKICPQCRRGHWKQTR